MAVFENGVLTDRLAPGDTEDYGILRFKGTLTYEVATVDGALLTSETFTWEEIHEEHGITIVVE